MLFCIAFIQFDINKIIRSLREQRQGMIQTKVSVRYFKTYVVVCLILKLINNSSRLTKEIMAVTIFGYLILISIEIYDFISPFSP